MDTLKNNSLATQISALMDGEQPLSASAATLRTLSAAADKRADWQLYHLIGDALRQEPDLAFDVQADVMSALAGEPTIVALQAVRQTRQTREARWSRRNVLRWQRLSMAAAATVAAVAVVAWVALAPNDNGASGLPTTVPAAPLAAETSISETQPATIAASAAVAKAAADKPLLAAADTPPAASPAAVDAHLQEYLMAHQAYATVGLPVGGINHIHTVSAER